MNLIARAIVVFFFQKSLVSADRVLEAEVVHLQTEDIAAWTRKLSGQSMSISMSISMSLSMPFEIPAPTIAPPPSPTTMTPTSMITIETSSSRLPIGNSPTPSIPTSVSLPLPSTIAPAVITFTETPSTRPPNTIPPIPLIPTTGSIPSPTTVAPAVETSTATPAPGSDIPSIPPTVATVTVPPSSITPSAGKGCGTQGKAGKKGGKMGGKKGNLDDLYDEDDCDEPDAVYPGSNGPSGFVTPISAPAKTPVTGNGCKSYGKSGKKSGKKGDMEDNAERYDCKEMEFSMSFSNGPSGRVPPSSAPDMTASAAKGCKSGGKVGKKGSKKGGDDDDDDDCNYANSLWSISDGPSSTVPPTFIPVMSSSTGNSCKRGKKSGKKGAEDDCGTGSPAPSGPNVRSGKKLQLNGQDKEKIFKAGKKRSLYSIPTSGEASRKSDGIKGLKSGI